MKGYVRKAIRDLKVSGKRKQSIKLKRKRDYRKWFGRILYNKFILTVQKKIVPSRVKNFLLRTTGMQVGYDVCVPHDIHFDPYFPELIQLEKGSLIGGGSAIHTHQLKGKQLTLGKCIAQERTLVGGMSVMLPGAVLNKNSILMWYSETDADIPSGVLWGGRPAKLLKRFSREDLEKYFKPSNGKYRQYYREFKKRVKEFRKDPHKNFFKIHYNGKRLNAGDDWWRARNVLRIFYNGIIIEITRRMPHCFLKTLLLKMVGVKIGKNCRIGKGTVFDHIYCDLITLGDNVTLDPNVYFDGHEYTITQTVFGKTLVKCGVHIQHHSYVRQGSTIGENTVVRPHSLVQKEVPANQTVQGMPAKPVGKQ